MKVLRKQIQLTKRISKKRYDAYLTKLDETDAYIKTQAESIPKESRVLVTAHDAFQYFARAYGFEVKGLQGG